ncbi:hypothetical protein [uncultured Microbulbifer sp.]|nr:hypothetical protein [uncultured Microbulbifer sp.]
MEFLQALQATGDIATVALVVCLWKFDRRLLAVELKHEETARLVRAIQN